MAAKAGRKSKHWAQRARVWAWYEEVKRRCGWTNHVLDREFAWTEEGARNWTRDQCPRVFDRIGERAQEPIGANPHLRTMSELVVAVDQHPQFNGTRALYDAAIWDLCQIVEITPKAVARRIENLLRTHDLVVDLPSKLFAPGEPFGMMLDVVTTYERCLELSLCRMDQFAAIELAWCLYLSTEPIDKWAIRERIYYIAGRLLVDFFQAYVNRGHHQRFIFSDEALDLLRKTKLDFTSEPTFGYGGLASWSGLPIIPRELHGKLTKEHISSSPTCSNDD